MLHCPRLVPGRTKRAYKVGSSFVSILRRKVEGRTPTAGILSATSSTPYGCFIPMYVGAASNRVVSCSQKTQAAVATSARGTQYAVTLITASCQTEKTFRVRNLDRAEACVLEQFSASGDGADIAVEGGFRTCCCRPCSGNTGNFCSDGKNILFGGKLYSCLSCEQLNHETTHGEGCATTTLHICTVCKKAFSGNRGFGQHMKMHSSKDSHECRSGNGQFTYTTTLVIYASAHSGESFHTCSICRKVFAQKASLVAHEKLHCGKKKPYVCGICRKCFMLRGNLVKHERLHSRETPYVCSICYKGFLLRRQLARHEKSHSAERSYACSICYKGFPLRSQLARHEKLHSAERRNVCRICNKSFATRSDLAGHERSQSGKRAYVCSICKKGFTTSCHLTRHEWLHSS
ncbi:uncharacterized protein LOC144158545 [Haemaphysalis longicornis]